MKLNKTQSEKLFEEAKKYFPGGVHSPVRAFKAVEGSPLFIKRGEGAMLYDEDNNEFIDFCCSWGPLILGHNHPDVSQKIIEAVHNGSSFGAPSRLGNEMGKLILDNHHFVDKIRFVSSGTEAVMSAIRLARGYTGRDKIIKFNGCYHGHVDSMLVKAGSGLITFGESSSAGIPSSFAKDTIVVELNDLHNIELILEKIGKEVAALIIEPIPANNGLLLQDTSFLVWLRKLCDDYDILLIFDEVISGFRIGFQGAARHYMVYPDLITFGKIIGGGLPVGAFAGKAEIMAHISPEGPVYQAGTLSANPLSMAAGTATLKHLLSQNFYENLSQNAEFFYEIINTYLFERNLDVSLVSIGSIFWIAFTKDRIQNANEIDPNSMDKFKKLHSYLLDHGVYFGPSGYEVGFISSAHDKNILEKAAHIICDGISHAIG